MSGSLSYRFDATDEHMHVGSALRSGDAIRVARGDSGVALYGQYLSLPAGRYTATLQFHRERPCRGDAQIDVCADFGGRVLAGKLVTGKQIERDGMRCAIAFSSADPLQNVEVRFGVRGGFAGEISGLEIVGEFTDRVFRVELADLPEVAVENALSNRRSLYDGYRRGIGLHFTDLPQKIVRDPDFREARELAGQRTILGHANLCNFFLLIKFYLPKLAPGHIVEFGSYHGGGAIFLAALARKFLPGCRVFGFDTFAGMPATDRRADAHQAGGFAGVDLAELRGYVDRIGLDNLEFVQGDFADTAAPTLQRAGSVVLAHLDCDIRSAIQCAYDTTRPAMAAGGYWVFDDPAVADCLGAAEAMEDLLIRRDGLNSEQVSPHYVFRQP